MSSRKLLAPGPFRAHHLHGKSQYEIVDGHPVRGLPTGRDGAGAVLDGGRVIASDPKVKRAGIDPGYAPDDLNLRAPDVAIIPEKGGPGWIPGVPEFAIEYAGIGQDEAELQGKIGELLARGTKVLWVVRLVGPRRVEVYVPGEAVRLVGPGDALTAPEFLANPVPVEALWDSDAADRATLRNLLERFGYRDPEAIREEGREEGAISALRASLRAVMRARSLPLDEVHGSRIAEERDPDVLRRWLERAAVATQLVAVFDG